MSYVFPFLLTYYCKSYFITSSYIKTNSWLHLCGVLFSDQLGFLLCSVETGLQILMHTNAISLTEYQLARPSDANRKEMLFGSLARPGHPMKKFFWGKFCIYVIR